MPARLSESGSAAAAARAAGGESLLVIRRDTSGIHDIHDWIFAAG
jgi:hypothetical protein